MIFEFCKVQYLVRFTTIFILYSCTYSAFGNFLLSVCPGRWFLHKGSVKCNLILNPECAFIPSILESRLALEDPLGIHRPTFPLTWRSHQFHTLHYEPLWKRSRRLEVQNDWGGSGWRNKETREWLCSSSLSKCKVDEDSWWIIPDHFQSQSEVSRVGRKKVYCAGHFCWKAVVDDKQVSLEINQSAQREKEMLRLWSWRVEKEGRRESRADKSLYSLMGCLSWDLASVGSRGIRRKMGNQKVSEVRCQSISPLSLSHQDWWHRERKELWTMREKEAEMCLLMDFIFAKSVDIAAKAKNRTFC